MSPVLSSELSREKSHASKIAYDGGCIRMRLVNFLIVLRVLDELMVVIADSVDVVVLDEVPNCSNGGVDLF